ncbi:hypothetical protein HWB40_gp50 [Streptomyces phage Manuel]|uniref:Uncharacterized protein n=1 Tax=Streptomyces phage Manuel TaxID=2053812 RepID=A0A2H4PQZ4_9CAUD|nr:hypothetical protein HWB40_gp50 [Streptomyces phage Manuel]ATW69345.1 hypothetical protein SEA_MANUEL_47 [Streptomyces phage Manuel]
MSRRNPASDRRARCPHCKVVLNQAGRPHRKNCKLKNNEIGWPRETEMSRRRP